MQRRRRRRAAAGALLAAAGAARAGPAAAVVPPHAAPPPSADQALCQRRCADTGHCCTGSVATNKNPSCAQGCLTAEYYYNRPAGRGIPDLDMDSCQKICEGVAGAGKCSWSEVDSVVIPDEVAYFSNCGADGRAPGVCPDHAGRPCDSASGAGGKNCVEGCTYFLYPERPVCDLADSGKGCADPQAPPGQPAPAKPPKPQNCDKKNCNDWNTCSIWCQKVKQQGCCSYVEQQCSFLANSTTLQWDSHPGAAAALCGPRFVPTGGSPAASGGLTWGWYFIIAFLCTSFVYCSVGITWRYKRKEMRGLEAIPNGDFWRDLPFLVKDGIVYTARGIKRKLSKDPYSTL